MAAPRRLKQVYRMDDLIDACTRPTYTQPVDEIHLRYLPSFSADWATEGTSFEFPKLGSGARWLGGPSAEERGAQGLIQIRDLLDIT
jgi:hypothetical protein